MALTYTAAGDVCAGLAWYRSAAGSDPVHWGTDGARPAQQPAWTSRERALLHDLIAMVSARGAPMSRDPPRQRHGALDRSTPGSELSPCAALAQGRQVAAADLRAAARCRPGEPGCVHRPVVFRPIRRAMRYQAIAMQANQLLRVGLLQLSQ